MWVASSLCLGRGRASRDLSGLSASGSCSPGRASVGTGRITLMYVGRDLRLGKSMAFVGTGSSLPSCLPARLVRDPQRGTSWRCLVQVPTLPQLELELQALVSLQGPWLLGTGIKCRVKDKRMASATTRLHGMELSARIRTVLLLLKGTDLSAASCICRQGGWR